MKRRQSNGYTIVELMMSLTVLAIGAAGVIAMQKVTLASSQYAKDLAIANGIAEAWADALAADGTQWNGANDLAAETIWLNQVNNSPLTWIRPAFNNQRQFGPGFGPLGNPVQNAAQASFCTDIRLAWLHPMNPPGSGLIRAEIRVFWKRRNAVTAAVLPANICDQNNPPARLEQGADADGYHFVFLTTAISQQGTGA